VFPYILACELRERLLPVIQTVTVDVNTVMMADWELESSFPDLLHTSFFLMKSNGADDIKISHAGLCMINSAIFVLNLLAKHYSDTSSGFPSLFKAES
jgi:hypothetical protein